MRMTKSRTYLAMTALLAVCLSASVLATSASASVQWIEEIDSFDGSLGTGPSLQLDAEGSPVVAYFNPELSTINLVRCIDASCRNGGTVNTVARIDQGETSWPSLRLTPAGNPVVAFLNQGRIQVVRCDDPVCDSGGETQFAVGAANVTGFPQLALSPGGFPSVVYINAAFGVDYVHCLTRSCSRSAGANSFDRAESATIPDLEFDPDGNPVIAYSTFVNDQPDKVRLIRCQDRTCQTGSTIVSGTRAISGLQLAFPEFDGDPEWYIAVGGSTGTGNSSRLYGESCRNDNCTGLDGQFDQAIPDRFPYVTDMVWSDTVGPVFAYNDFDLSGHIQIASRAEAIPNRVYSVGELERYTAPDTDSTGFFWPDIELHDDQAVIAYVTFDGIRITECSNAGCVPSCNGELATVDMGVEGQLAQGRPDAVVYGTNGDDNIGFGQVICGRDGDDFIAPGVAKSRVFAGPGNDDIRLLNSGKGFVSGGPGNDRILGSKGLDRLFGGPGADTIDGLAGPDRLSGGDGNDVLNGGLGEDKIFGNLGRDTIDGGPGNDFIKGGGWIDTVDGGAGDDDRCGIVEGEIRVNCERGVFGS